MVCIFNSLYFKALILAILKLRGDSCTQRRQEAPAMSTGEGQYIKVGFMRSILIYYYCYNKSPQIQWLKTTSIYSFIVLESKNLKSHFFLGLQNAAAFGGIGKGSAFLPFLAHRGYLMSFSSQRLPHSPSSCYFNLLLPSSHRLPLPSTLLLPSYKDSCYHVGPT